MSLWWLQPGWGDATCADCGKNIKADGGDPDWGFCYDCFSRRIDDKRRAEREERAYWDSLQRPTLEEEIGDRAEAACIVGDAT